MLLTVPSPGGFSRKPDSSPVLKIFVKIRETRKMRVENQTKTRV
jgi:hypothetical protein